MAEKGVEEQVLAMERLRSYPRYSLYIQKLPGRASLLALIPGVVYSLWSSDDVGFPTGIPHKMEGVP